MRDSKKVIWFDPGACRYIATTFEDVAGTLANGTVPGYHAGVCYEADNTEDPLWKRGGGREH